MLSTLAPRLLVAQTAIDENSPWPRVRSTNGNTVTLHQPQVERWTSNSFVARAVVEVKAAEAKKDSAGVVWFEAHGNVDHSNRLVVLDQLEIKKARFQGTTDNGSNALGIVRELFPSGARTVSLDYLITTLGFAQATARQGARGFKRAPPAIIWATNRTVLVVIDGEPVLRPIPGGTLSRVINTPALIVNEKSGKFFLEGDERWFSADSLNGPWSLAQVPPAEVAGLSPQKSKGDSPATGGSPPQIIVSTSPAELLVTDGIPEFRPIRGTALQYAADTDSQLFFHTGEATAYLLLSGRWFKASTLNGPWTYVSPHDLPGDFARIPPNTPQGVVLASVPGTPQADLALLANAAPTTATVNRRTTTIQLRYDGEPKFKSIEGTSMSYAVNAQLPVIHSGEHYYAVDNGVWFVAAAPAGPWDVAAEVPEKIYTIPPNSPVYYATFVHVYDADDENVEEGYTSGYTGAYEDEGTMVYGTGWEYEPWYGDDYYGWGWSWGYGQVYLPWYGWWVWRPWWNERGGLRAALVENIYDRWQSGHGVIHHDRPPGNLAKTPPSAFSGYPALYGRFKGSSRPASLPAPANTLALNPYSRPKTAARPGDLPAGAQLLSTLRESPSGGRDLYGSPDGNIYLRKNDGWYRRQPSGHWSLYAPTQGSVERAPAPTGPGGTQPTAAPGGDRIAAREKAAATKTPARDDRVPNVANEVQAQQVTDLEREYYARNLAQMRMQNTARPARGGGGRR